MSPSVDRKLKRRRIMTNVHADKNWKTHEVTWSFDSDDAGEREFVNALERGRWVDVEAHARFRNWRNEIQSVRIDIYTAAVR